MGQYVIGDRVTQAQYGDGTVKSVDTYHTKIDFDSPRHAYVPVRTGRADAGLDPRARENRSDTPTEGEGNPLT